MAAQTTRARKRQLRDLNKQAWDGQKDVFKTTGSLDSSLKKNTAVIKRLRTALGADSQSTLLKEIQTISLEKYLPEVISAVADGLQKLKNPSDFAAAVEVVSALHQRFQENFTPHLTFALGRGLATPRPDVLKGLTSEQKEREEKDRLARQRTLLRVAVDLWLVGVVRTWADAAAVDDAKVGKVNGAARKVDDSEPFPLEVLKELLGRDREHVNILLVVQLAKNFAYDLLGAKPRSTSRKNVEEDGATTVTKENGNEKQNGENANASEAEGNAIDEQDPPLVTPELQTRFRNVMTKYFESVKAHIFRQHKFLQTQQAKNADAYVKSGEVFEDRQSNYERLCKLQEKFIANAQVIADILGEEMPDLPDEKDEETAGDSIIREGGSMFSGRGEDGGKSGIWQDEDQRRFYEDLIDLRVRVPAILLEDGKKKKGDDQKDEDKKKSEENGAAEPGENGGAETPEGADDQKAADDAASTAIVNKTIGAQVDALLIRLPELTNRDLIDQAAVDFCFLNSKASRNRLLKTLEEVPRGRQDLLPYYSRLIATLNCCLPDIGKGIVEYLDKEFRSLQRRKEKDLSEVRARNVRYLAELTKFGVVPQHVIFHCLKVALEDFHRVNIDVICNILENCGKFLLRTPETAPRMTLFLETLRKKKDGVQYLGHQERVVIENAFYYVNPPERPAIVQKERSVMELYVRKMIYLDLTKRNYVKILKHLRKLHWEDPAIVSMLLKVFTKIWKVRYNNIHILAILVGALSRYHQDFAYAVIDEVLESISVGLEQNNFKHNQRRIAIVKYLGELYNYKLIDSPVIFDALYRIVTFGHEGGTPRPGVNCPVDGKDDFFRIRLVCTLLDVIGMCFERGSAKRKLDFFLTFFQYYIHTKDPLPMDIEFIIQDTFSLIRPSMKLHTTLEEAGKAFEEAVQKTYKTALPSSFDRPVSEQEAEDEEASSSSEDEDAEAEIIEHPDDEDVPSDTEQAEAEEEVQANDSSTSEEDECVVTMNHAEVDPEAEREFEREFAKMMQESLDARKFERKPVFDVPLPIKRSTSSITPGVSRENTFEETFEKEDGGKMMFSLLTKKGNRQVTRMVELPSDSGFAVAMKSSREQERVEKQKIKELVMSYDRMEDVEEEREVAGMGQAGVGRWERGGGSGRMGRGRKLSLSDMNW
ncbi:mRNA decay protein [Rhizina undulata]